jgi:hypothetical protein
MFAQGQKNSIQNDKGFENKKYSMLLKYASQVSININDQKIYPSQNIKANKQSETISTHSPKENST